MKRDKSGKMIESIKVAYFVVNEDLYSPLLRRQVVELLQDIKKRSDTVDITIFLFQSLTALVSKRRRIKYLHNELKKTGINFVVLPNICPWPVPNFSFRKTDVGWRPNGVWNRWAARFFSVYAQLFMIPIFLIGNFDIFHCRSYPASFAAMVTKKLFPRLKLLFDPRSDFPEESVVAGRWQTHSKDFHFWKNQEKNLLETSDAVACISHAYVDHFKVNSKQFSYFIAPNNVRTSFFKRSLEEREIKRKNLGFRDTDVVFAYLGGMTKSGWHRPEFYKTFFCLVKNEIPGAKLLMLIPEHAKVFTKEIFSDVEGVAIVSPKFFEVSDWLSAADFGLMFMRKRRLAVGTKIGEYLSASLPIISNPNSIGTCQFLEQYPDAGAVVGLGLGDLDNVVDFSSLANPELQMPEKKTEKFRRIGEKVFDNFVIAEQYIKTYNNFNVL